MIKVGIIFHRLGPYHIARIRSLSAYFDTTCVELSGITSEYLWDKVTGSYSFQRITLFENIDSRKIPIKVLKERIFDLLNSLEINYILINGWSEKAALIALDWSISKKIPAILMSESTEFDFRRIWYKEWFKRNLINLYSGALVGGILHKNYLVKLGMSSENICTGYDVIDNEYFYLKTNEIRHQSALREKFSLPNKYFLASKRFIQKKNINRLLNSYKLYRQASHDPWDLVIIGDGPLRNQIISVLEELDLQKSVHLPGFIQYNEIPIYYAFAQAFVHASTTEQWGLVVNEAMASGLPVIVSNKCGCVPELVHNKKNGFTFDPYDIVELASLLRIVENLTEEELLNLKLESLKIIENFNPKKFGEGVYCLINLRRIKLMNINRRVEKIILRFLIYLNLWK